MGTYVLFWSASLLSSLGIRRRLSTNLFLFVIFIFIGLRLDTGFDWPVYKLIYADFVREFSLQKLALYSLVYNQEPGFLFLLGLASKYLFSYEVFQAIITILMLWSTVLLTRTLGVKRVAFVMAVILTYLLWSVGFSTLRQSMAISFFNFGLVLFLRKQSRWGIACFIVAALFQLSGIVYIAAFVASRYLWQTRKPPALGTFLLAIGAASVLAPLGLTAISMVSSLAAEKIKFYVEGSAFVEFGISDGLFLIFFATSALLVSRSMVKPGMDVPFASEIRRLIMVLAAIGASSSFLIVLRDRVSYELFILVSIYLMMPGLRYRWAFVGFFVCFGLANSFINIFPHPNQLAFAPYQNVIIHYALQRESTGSSRNASFMEALSEMSKR